MNRTELYYKTIDTLLDAYNSGQLFHGSCSHCAVGNICGGQSEWCWITGITNSLGEHVSFIFANLEVKSKSKELVLQSGYTVEELTIIEHSFETAIIKDRCYYTGEGSKEGQYLGLVAVLKELARIHEERLEKAYQDKINHEPVQIC